MTKKQSIQVFGVLGLIVLSSLGAYGAYTYMQGGGPIQDNYKDNLTFEEVEQKIISYQARGYKVLREAIEENIEQLSEVYYVAGDLDMDGKVESPFLGSMSFDISAEDYSLQVQESTFDFQIGNLLMKYILSPLELTEEESIDLSISGENLHTLLSDEGFFAGAETLELNIPFLENSIKQAVEYFIGQGKYLDFGLDDEISEIFETSEITGTLTEIDEIFLDSLGVFLENESLFEVVSQEETKYYLRPSLAACSFVKGLGVNFDTYNSNMFAGFFGEEPEDYIQIYNNNGFHSEIEECSEEEYKELTEGIKYFFDGEIKMFIEVANLRAHIGIEAQEETVGVLKAGSVISLKGIQESYLNIDFTSDDILGEGIHFTYTQKDGLLGKIDIRDTEGLMSVLMEIRESEQTNVRDMSFDFNFKEEFFTQTDITANLKGSMGDDRFEMNGSIDASVMGTQAKNTLSLKSKILETSSEFEFGMDTILNVESGSPDIEAKTEIRVNTQSNNNKEEIVSSISVSAPNLFRFEFNMKDEHEVKNEALREIVSPEDTFSIEELEQRIRVNTMRNRARGIDEVEVDLGVIIPALGAYSQDAINSKVVSDIRTLVSMIETRSITTGLNIENILGDITDDYSTEDVVHKVGYIDYDILGANKNDFEYDRHQAYKIAIYFTEIDGQAYRFYQVMGVTVENGVDTATIRGNYIQLNQDAPVGLFKHPRNGVFLQNGDTLR